jgi:hypothetical protein
LIEKLIIKVLIDVAVSSDIKRKGVGEQQEEFPISSLVQSKTARLDYGQESIIESENEPDRRCVDLIVLGISYRSIEADVKKCFEAFGELVFCEVEKQKYLFVVFFIFKNNRLNVMQMVNHVDLVLYDLKIMNLN